MERNIWKRSRNTKADQRESGGVDIIAQMFGNLVSILDRVREDVLGDLIAAILTRIEVIGHSLSDVDLPYFCELAKRNIRCNWILYCYQTSDQERMIQQLMKCGVARNMVQIRLYSSVVP